MSTTSLLQSNATQVEGSTKFEQKAANKGLNMLTGEAVAFALQLQFEEVPLALRMQNRQKFSHLSCTANATHRYNYNLSTSLTYSVRRCYFPSDNAGQNLPSDHSGANAHI